MKISAKSRYAFAALIQMGQTYDTKEPVAVTSLSDKLGISKIYLEQVFSLLRRGGIVVSIKGAQGGYQLAREMRDITAFDILSSIESSLFDQADATVQDKSPGIESVLQNDVFKRLDMAIAVAMQEITLDVLVTSVEQYDDGYMYYL